MIDLLPLAQQCAPEIPPQVIVAIAKQESSGNQFAIGHRDYPPSKQPKTFGEASRIADELTVAGERFDIGLMQINSKNLSWVGLDNISALDPCANMAAAQKIILEGIKVEGKDTSSFFNTISRYNSGNETTGYNNGYVTGVTVKLLNEVTAEDPQSPPNEKEKTLSQWEQIGQTKGLFSRSRDSEFAQSSSARDNSDLFTMNNKTHERKITRPDSVQGLGADDPGQPSSIAYAY